MLQASSCGSPVWWSQTSSSSSRNRDLVRQADLLSNPCLTNNVSTLRTLA